MSNVGSCYVCYKESSLRECDFCKVLNCDVCNISHKQEQICSFFQEYNVKEKILSEFGQSDLSRFNNFCTRCYKPIIGNECNDKKHNRVISIRSVVKDLIVEVSKERKWLEEKDSKVKTCVDQYPVYLKKIAILESKIKEQPSENKDDVFRLKKLRELQNQLEEDMRTFNKKFSSKFKIILIELNLLAKIKSPLTFLPVWLDMRSKINIWKGTLSLQSTHIALPDLISSMVENEEVSNLETFFDCFLYSDEKLKTEPDLMNHDSDFVDNLAPMSRENVTTHDSNEKESRANRENSEYLQHLLEVLYKLSQEEHCKEVDKGNILLGTYCGTHLEDIAKKTEQTANKLIQLRQECLEKEDEILRLSSQYKAMEDEMNAKLNNEQDKIVQDILKENQTMRQQLAGNEHQILNAKKASATQAHLEEIQSNESKTESLHFVQKSLTVQKDASVQVEDYEIQNFREQVESYKQEMNELMAKRRNIEERENEFRVLQPEIESINKTKNELKQANNTINESNECVKNLEKERTEMQYMTKQKDESGHKKNDEIRKLNDRIISLEQEIKEHKHRYYDEDQSLRSEVQSLKKQKDELEKNIKDNLKKIEEQKYTLYLENTGLQNRQTKIDEERLKENKIQELKLLNESLRKQNKELEMQTKNMEQGNSEMEKSYRDEVQFLKSEVESLTKQNDELKQHAIDNPQTLEEHKHTLYQESIEIENRPTENDKEQKIQELQLMNESITKKNKELKKDILHLKGENTELHNKQRLTDEIQCKENERLNSEIYLLTKRMAESEQQTRDIINGLTQDNKELKKRLEEQDINFCKIVVANEEINEKLREKERVIKESHDLYEKYQTNLKQLQDKNENEKRQLLSAIKQGNDALVFQKKEKEDLKYSYGAHLSQLQQQLENEKQQFLSKMQESNDAVSVLRKEKDDLQNRLSSIAGEKLTKGNPAITDLGDPNRPMKIGEKYGELYDNEWTDAIECTGDLKRLNTDLKSSEIEEIVIHHLYKILTQCYQECLKLSNDQLMNVFQMTQVDTSKVDTDKESLPGCKEVLEIRRQHADKFAKELYQNKMLADKIVSSNWQYPRKSEDLMRRLMETSFYEKCVNLCWSMAIQNPVMVLSEDLPPGSVYDKNVFKEFVQSGNKVQYVVWPALYLYKNGPLLFKGVVQACK